MAEAGKRLLKNVVSIADKMEKASQAKAAAQAEMNKPAPALTAKPGTDVIAEQRRINAIRAEEARLFAKAQLDFNAGKTAEDAAINKMNNIQKDVEKAVDDPESFGITLEKLAPEPSTAQSNPPINKDKPAVKRHKQ